MTELLSALLLSASLVAAPTSNDEPLPAFTAAPDGALVVDHELGGIRGRVDEFGITVAPLDSNGIGSEEPVRLSLRTVGLVVDEELRSSRGAVARVDDRRLERPAGPLVEWYTSVERGIEHGWTIPSPIGSAGGELRIELELVGLAARIADDGLSAVFVDGRGRTRVRYDGLVAWDAGGRALDARLVPGQSGLAVLLSDAGARYPLTIDPLLSGPVWIVESDQAHAYLGYGLDGAGDVNGDGYADVLAAAYAYDDPESSEGLALVYFGSPSGPSTLPDWQWEPDVTGASFGWSAASAGDVDGDGFDDIVVGAYGLSDPEPEEGRVYLFRGSPTGPSLVPDWTYDGNQDYARVGFSVASAGDVDGDDYDDVIVGASGYSNGEAIEGAALVFHGSAAGLSPTPDWMVEGNQAAAGLGRAVAGAGDVDGDGYDDVIVAAPLYHNGIDNAGRVFVHLGGAAGLETTPVWTTDGSEPNGQLGRAVAGAGDVNGDGFADVLVSSGLINGPGNDFGRAYLFLGSPAGPSLVADWTAEGQATKEKLGASVDGAGDVNADGFDDVLVGSSEYTDDQTAEGRAQLYLGSPTGLSLAADWSAHGNKNGAQFGAEVSGAGDVDGDGAADVLIAAPTHTQGQTWEGRVYLFLGIPIVDCNGNGVDDADDIANGTSTDGDGDGIPDECEVGNNYCGPAVANSSGQPAIISAVGSALVADDDLTLEAHQLPTSQFGYFLVSMTQDFITNPGGSQGNLCLGGQIGRYVKDVASTGATGTLTLPIDLTALPPPINQGVQAGETWNFQLWFRDKNPDPTSNFSDGVAVLFS